MFGGVLYAILLALINFSLQTEYSKIKDVAIPTLNLAKGIHPWLGLVLTVIMLAVMYNTILGLCYSFAARFTEPYSKKYQLLHTFMIKNVYFNREKFKVKKYMNKYICSSELTKLKMHAYIK
ncbi:Uncharacterized membrane protein [Mycobacteroides abscessus subsp. abscessus]|nr:Uncharacterized membrane protein [Mycobacteroides abscessus subsp. abscessus]